MKQNTLDALHCPYCGWRLGLLRGIDVRQGEVINGIVKCNCSRYPLVEGILVLRTSCLNAVNQALLWLQRNNPREALLCLLQPRTTAMRIVQAAKYRGVPFSAAIERFKTNLSRPYLNRALKAGSFSSLTDKLKFISYGGYFKYRFSTTSFIAGIPLIMLMRDSQGPILEIGCGMGHHGFVISQLYPQRPLQLSDFSFINLYLAKRFFVPDAEYVCLDANDPLPFSNRSFKAIFSSDFFHYLHSKKLAMQEISRVCAADGIVLLSHLHNLSGGDPAPGEPLTALGWLGLSCFSQTKLFTETSVFRDFVSEGRLDLMHEPTERELKDANAFALVAASRQELFRSYEGLSEDFFNLRRRLMINPVYRISLDGDKALLRKRWPAKFIQDENTNIDKILPDTFSLDREFLKEIIEGRAPGLNTHRVAELLKCFVLINTPEHY